MSNKFNELLENKLHTPILEGKEIEFDVSLSISDYKKFAANSTALQKQYSVRDFKAAADKARDIIINKMDIDLIPLSVDIVSDFKRSLGPNVIYTITVSGDNIKFLNKLEKVGINENIKHK